MPNIKITKHGSFLVDASIPLYEEQIVIKNGVHSLGRIRQIDTSGYVSDGSYMLCRCGKSSNAPFCDGAHIKAHFNGTERASRADYFDRARLSDEGGGLKLYDDGRCAFARFCHREKGDVWTLTDYADNPESKKEAIAGALACPTGRLVHLDSDNQVIREQDLKTEIAIIQDPEEGCSGGIFVRGDIQLIGVDGFEYEKRDKIALCRCGRSTDMPFCDASHARARFNDKIGK